ncbi:hypothetical protein [Mycolicibacterium sp. XJ647]
MAFTTAAAGLIGAAGFTLFKGFERYKTIDAAKNRLENLNRVLAQTGRATIDVGKVMDTVNDVVQDTRFSLSDAFAVSTTALSSPTGDLKRFMTVVANTAQFTGQSIEQVGQAFLNVANAGKVGLEDLNNQLSGIPKDWLAAHLGVGLPELNKMLEKNQVGLEDLLQTMEKNVAGFAKGGVGTLEGAIEQMNTAISRLGANTLSAVFGEPMDDVNGLTDAVNAFAKQINNVNTWVTAHRDDIKRYFDQAVDAAQSVGNAVGDVMGALDSLNVDIGDVALAFGAWKLLNFTGLIGNLGRVGDSVKGIGMIRPAAGSVLAILAGIELARPSLEKWGDEHLPRPEGAPSGFVGLDIAGSVRQPAQSGVLPTAPNTSDPATVGGIPIPGLLIPNPVTPKPLAGTPIPQDQWRSWWDPSGGGPAPAGSPILGPSGADGSSGSGPKLPDAPVVPFDATLPAGFAGLPQTASMHSAQSAFLDARHDLAEKTARLNQLEQSNVATEDDIQKARNDKLEAERDLQGAELRLRETAQSATEKYTKTLNGAATDLGQIGAQLDKDFGISKGLAGIAENITKFVANLAAAPLLGQLGAVSAVSPTQGGHGLMGVLGAQGAFGPQYMNNQYAQASAMGPAALQSGFSGNVAAMMALAQGASGRTKYAPASDLVNGLADCSGSISDLVEVLQTGQTSPGRLFTTTNFASDAEAAKLGFRPGFMPGALNVGVNPYPGQSGHMAATLPNGVNFEGGGGTGGGAQYGGNAAGALDSQFEKQYYLPLGSTMTPTAQTGWFPTNTGLTGVPGMAGGPLGNGMPQSAPFGSPAPGVGPGPAPGPTAIGGGPGLSGVGKGGVGYEQGGLIDMGIQAGALAADMFAPGAGQVAQTGAKLVNRAIEFGSQAVGIGVQGAMDTVIPFGGSELASNNWITRFVGGLAGAAPALPNMAGKAAGPLSKEQAQQGQQGQQPQQQPPQINVEYNATNQTEDRNGAHLSYHLQNMHAAPGH